MKELNNQKIIVTIGIPLYNAENFIEDAINSVLKQTYQNFELIISNDSSTDHSLTIVKNINDPRIKIIDGKENKGISYRLNEQVSIANGKYFARMDADDIMHPERISKQVSFLEKNPHIDLLGTSAIIIDDDNQILGIRSTKKPQKMEDVIVGSPFIHPTVCGKLTWFKKNIYTTTYDGAEDYALWMKAFPESNYEVLQEPLLFYRDPLKFKIKTFLSRLKVQRKMFRENSFLQKNRLLKMKLILITYMKGFASKVMVALGKEDRLIARRNQNLINSEKLKYENLLNSITS